MALDTASPRPSTDGQTAAKVGEIISVIGPVVDIRFPPDQLPEILNAVKIEAEGIDLTTEVAQMRGDDVVRCIAMSSTDGLVRGMRAVDTGGPIRVPVGRQTLGRVFDLRGNPIDERAPSRATELWPSPRAAPQLDGHGAATDRTEPAPVVIGAISPI